MQKDPCIRSPASETGQASQAIHEISANSSTEPLCGLFTDCPHKKSSNTSYYYNYYYNKNRVEAFWQLSMSTFIYGSMDFEL